MSKFDSICSRIQEAISTFSTNTNNQQKQETDLDALANTLAKTTDPAAIKKTLGTLVNPIPGAPQPTANLSNTQGQPSISMTGTSGPTTSTTNQAGQRVQTPTPAQPQTNTQAAKQQLKDEEIDKILNDIGVDRIYNRLQKTK